MALRAIAVGAGGVEGLTILPIPGSTISGRVHIEGDAAAANLAAVTAQFFSVDPGPGFIVSTSMNSDGTFRVEDVPPARYKVIYPLPGYYLKAVRSESRELPDRVVDLDASPPVKLDLILSPKPGSVTGSVVSSGSDQPCPEVNVVLIPQEADRKTDPHAYLQASTDSCGRFTIHDIPPGDYRAFAWERNGFDNFFMDPAFLGPLESRGVAVSLAESDHPEIKLTLIPTDLR
ncbi:MAG TPA: hypothetical protein VKU19_04985 [Bryobacteraceae bacterium]|nr:hypothetical protein [Bryobacteraceae bacterium]